LRFELLQEAEARRSGRVPGSAVLCHAETLLAAVRHLITNANSAVHFLHPRAATGAKLHGGERIALIIKRREASNAASGDRAWGKFLHSRDVLRTATEPMTAKEIASGVLASPKAMHQMPSICMGPQAAKFGHLGWAACINIAKCLQLVRTAESFAAPTSIIGSNFCWREFRQFG
jgi:hypothetical protein